MASRSASALEVQAGPGGTASADALSRLNQNTRSSIVIQPAVPQRFRAAKPRFHQLFANSDKCHIFVLKQLSAAFLIDSTVLKTKYRMRLEILHFAKSASKWMK
jgi:hypothetical protein